MTKHIGGEQVRAGFYMGVADWKIETLSGAGGVLPGDAGKVYRRVPMIVMLMAAPLLGAAFAMFLPFIGLALVAQHAAKMAWAAALEMGDAALVAMSPRLAPGEAYLTGDQGEAKKADEPEARLDTLDEELKGKDEHAPTA